MIQLTSGSISGEENVKSGLRVWDEIVEALGKDVPLAKEIFGYPHVLMRMLSQSRRTVRDAVILLLATSCISKISVNFLQSHLPTKTVSQTADICFKPLGHISLLLLNAYIRRLGRTRVKFDFGRSQ